MLVLTSIITADVKDGEPKFKLRLYFKNLCMVRCEANFYKQQSSIY